jgi:hypothetical protein
VAPATGAGVTEGLFVACILGSYFLGLAMWWWWRGAKA